MAPKNSLELSKMLDFAIKHNGPVATRYPRGEVSLVYSNMENEIVLGKSELIQKGNKVAVIVMGDMHDIIEEVNNMLIKDNILISGLLYQLILRWLNH